MSRMTLGRHGATSARSESIPARVLPPATCLSGGASRATRCMRRCLAADTVYSLQILYTPNVWSLPRSFIGDDHTIDQPDMEVANVHGRTQTSLPRTSRAASQGSRAFTAPPGVVSRIGRPPAGSDTFVDTSIVEARDYRGTETSHSPRHAPERAAYAFFYSPRRRRACPTSSWCATTALDSARTSFERCLDTPVVDSASRCNSHDGLPGIRVADLRREVRISTEPIPRSATNGGVGQPEHHGGSVAVRRAHGLGRLGRQRQWRATTPSREPLHRRRQHMELRSADDSRCTIHRWRSTPTAP